MEKIKNVNLHRNSHNFYIANTLRTINFNWKNTNILDPSTLNLSNSRENNSKENSYSLNNKIFINSFKKNYNKTRNSLYINFKRNLKNEPMSILTKQNENQITDSLDKNSNLNAINTNITNSLEINNNSLKQLKTFSNTYTNIKQELNTFSLINNNNNNINNTNNNILLDKKKFKNLLVNDINEKALNTSLLSERNIKSNNFNNINDINKINSLNKYKTSLRDSINYLRNFNKKKEDNHSYKRNNIIFGESKILLNPHVVSKKILLPQNKNNNLEPKINPLLIPEEDKIFNEMKKYLCFKYDQKELKKSHISKEPIDNVDSSKNLKIKILKNKSQTIDKRKLNYLYLSNNILNKKISHIKKKKDRKNLTDYQNNLLNVIKPSISEDSYDLLKERLTDIRMINNIKYQNNYKKIKEIENKEEEIINEFNNTCGKCLSNFKRIRDNKEILFYTNLRIKLPFLNFVSCLKKQKIKKKKSHKKNN